MTAEALALRYGLSLEHKAGCNRLIVNSDNLEVIETMKNGGRSTGTAAAVFDDCYFLDCDFPLTSFEHCFREANKVAHELAKLARFSSTSDWFEDPLPDIVQILINDVTSVSNE